MTLREGEEPLYLAPDARAFASRFARDAGCTVHELLARHVALDSVSGCVVVGATPLGIGDRASAVRLVVLIETTAGDLPLPSVETRALIPGVRVCLEFFRTKDVLALAGQLAGANVEWERRQAELMSGLKTGWVLRQNQALEEALRHLRADPGLEIHCATKDMVVALKFLEDAVAALSDMPELALHLGRLCVECCFTAFFASQGYAMLGSQWLRFYVARLQATAFSREPWLASGLPLLFPERQLEEEGERDYLRRVRDLLLATRAAIEKNLPFKLAFRLAPQIYVPAAVP